MSNSFKTKLEFKPHWMIDAPPEELRLIIKALESKLLAEETFIAQQLASRLKKQRTDLAEGYVKQMQNAEQAARRVP